MSRRRSSIHKKVVIKQEPVDDVEIFEVEKILDKRIVCGKVCMRNKFQQTTENR